MKANKALNFFGGIVSRKIMMYSKVLFITLCNFFIVQSSGAYSIAKYQ